VAVRVTRRCNARASGASLCCCTSPAAVTVTPGPGGGGAPLSLPGPALVGLRRCARSRSWPFGRPHPVGRPAPGRAAASEECLCRRRCTSGAPTTNFVGAPESWDLGTPLGCSIGVTGVGGAPVAPADTSARLWLRPDPFVAYTLRTCSLPAPPLGELATLWDRGRGHGGVAVPYQGLLHSFPLGASWPFWPPLLACWRGAPGAPFWGPLPFPLRQGEASGEGAEGAALGGQEVAGEGGRGQAVGVPRRGGGARESGDDVCALRRALSSMSTQEPSRVPARSDLRSLTLQ